MTGKPLIRRERARRDLEETAHNYFAEGGEALELRFINAIDSFLTKLSLGHKNAQQCARNQRSNRAVTAPRTNHSQPMCATCG